jgi:hypothetical protein
MKTIKKVLFTTAIASLAFVSCINEKEKSIGITLENMDVSVKASDDFFNHVNGNWIKILKFQKIKLLGVALMNSVKKQMQTY